MSKQTLSLDKWDKIKKAFRDHFDSKNVEIDNDMFEYSRGSEILRIEKEGDISGAMPLHEVNLSKAKEIVFASSGVELKTEEDSYVFKR